MLSIEDMENKNWLKSENGKWKVESGKWKVESGNLRSVVSLQISNFNFRISNFKFLSSAILVLLLSTSHHAHAQVMTLDSILQLINGQNHMLQEYDTKIKSLNAYTEGAKSWMAPMIGAGTFMTPYPGQSGIEEASKGSIMISVEQNIPNPSKLNANKRYLESKAAIAEQGRSYQFNNLRADAKTLYYQWLVAEAKIKVLQENGRAL